MSEDKPAPHHDLLPFIYRVEAMEKADQLRATQFIELKTEMAKLETNVNGIREQAKAHNEAHTRSMQNVETLIGAMGRELQGGMDKIITTLGIDEDPKAAKGLKQNLDFLDKFRKSREDLTIWVWRGVITIVITGMGTLLFAGAVRIVGQAQHPMVSQGPTP